MLVNGVVECSVGDRQVSGHIELSQISDELTELESELGRAKDSDHITNIRARIRHQQHQLELCRARLEDAARLS